jgi:glucose-6-phosphate 1-dehydrogenase
VQDFNIYGYARSKMDEEEFRDLIALTLTCRLTEEKAGDCTNNMEYFLERCHYCAGNYDVAEDFDRLDKDMKRNEVRKAKRPHLPLRNCVLSIRQFVP